MDDADENACPFCGKICQSLTRHFRRAKKCQALYQQNLDVEQLSSSQESNSANQPEARLPRSNNAVHQSGDDVSSSKKPRSLGIIAEDVLNYEFYDDDTDSQHQLEDNSFHPSSSSDDFQEYFPRQHVEPHSNIIPQKIDDTSKFHLNAFDSFPSHLYAIVIWVFVERMAGLD